MPEELRLFRLWLVVATLCVLSMWWAPGQETIPYHAGWLGFGVAFGIEAWGWLPTVVSTGAYTLLTGAIMVDRARDGTIAWEELWEIPLMSSLLLVVVWNVRRRQDTLASMARLAEQERVRAAKRERLCRMTSHEIRTPVTIATGYVEILAGSEDDPERQRDLAIVSGELERVTMATDRLVRMLRLQDDGAMLEVRLDEVLSRITARWDVVAERTWLVEVDPISHVCSPGRLLACLDTLIENAVRWTTPGDTIRVFGNLVGDRVLIGVADSGPGMEPALMASLNQGAADGRVGLVSSGDVPADARSRTGLGLAIVGEAAIARQGRMAVGRAAEGGALVVMAFPQRTLRTRDPAPLLDLRSLVDEAPSPSARAHAHARSVGPPTRVGRISRVAGRRQGRGSSAVVGPQRRPGTSSTMQQT